MPETGSFRNYGFRESNSPPGGGMILQTRIEADGNNISFGRHHQIDNESPVVEGQIIQAVGPDETIAHDELLALEESKGTYEEPYIGMQFDSEEDVRIFYNKYARFVGFSIRVGHNRRSRRDKSNITRTFVCSKEGFKRNKDGSIDKGSKERLATRVGCKAMLIVKKKDNGKWFVTKFEKEHNHRLVNPDEVHCLRSHRRGPFTQRDYHNYLSHSKRGFLERGDTQFLLEYFAHMQSENPAFFYTVQVAKEDHLSNFFWVDARSRAAYNYFGELVCFDTTYKTNRYKVPFLPFTGVNQHQQSILFGCALLQDETEASFVWLFTSWLKAMNGRYPKVILTDQDPSLRAAIAQVFPDTHHRFSMWNIKSKVREKLGHIFRLHEEFEVEFERCIGSMETKEEFKSSWKKLMERYNLKNNTWIQSLYTSRDKWIPAYLRGHFFAGMSTIQRSESMNTIFNGYIHSQTTLREFVVQFDKALDNRYHKEREADLETIYTHPILMTAQSMEKRMAEIYTRTIFLKFREELFESSVYMTRKTEGDGKSIIYKVFRNKQDGKSYNVMFNPSEMTVSCSCCLFEFIGILCRHALKVLSLENIPNIPECYILKRWTRNAKCGDINDVRNNEIQTNPNETITSRFNELCHQVIKYAEEGATTLDIFNAAIHSLEAALEEVVNVKKNMLSAQQSISCGGNVMDLNTTENSQVTFPANHLSLSDSQAMTIEQPSTNPVLSMEKYTNNSRTLRGQW